MIPDFSGQAPLATPGDDDLLTRAEASAFLALLGVRLKPATLARLWSTGSNGPPCRHVRARPYYPREKRASAPPCCLAKRLRFTRSSPRSARTKPASPSLSRKTEAMLPARTLRYTPWRRETRTIS